MDSTPLVDFAPVAQLALMAALLALLPLGYLWLRSRGADTRSRLAALTALTLFLTFDLVVFGSFTRLTDSGLGCPDWPGCYGRASPIGASAQISAAQEAMPTGPVTFSKAWIEMIHRYLAMTVGVLIVVMTVVSWLERRRLPHSPWWPTATLVWVIVQGLFGKYTVTLKLYPAIVTLHLLGGQLLLVLLALQHEAFADRRFELRDTTRRWVWVALLAVFAQSALGGWVSTNYAVLACTDFPRCNGQWWPVMDFAQGFTVLRELGQTAAGAYLPFEALVAIHVVHRAGAVVASLALIVALILLSREAESTARRFAALLGSLLVAQLASGLSNVVLGWPLAAALAHAAGAAALVLMLSLLLARTRAPAPARMPVAGVTAAS